MPRPRRPDDRRGPTQPTFTCARGGQEPTSPRLETLTSSPYGGRAIWHYKPLAPRVPPTASQKQRLDPSCLIDTIDNAPHPESPECVKDENRPVVCRFPRVTDRSAAKSVRLARWQLESSRPRVPSWQPVGTLGVCRGFRWSWSGCHRVSSSTAHKNGAAIAISRHFLTDHDGFLLLLSHRQIANHCKPHVFSGSSNELPRFGGPPSPRGCPLRLDARLQGRREQGQGRLGGATPPLSACFCCSAFDASPGPPY